MKLRAYAQDERPGPSLISVFTNVDDGNPARESPSRASDAAGYPCRAYGEVVRPAYQPSAATEPAICRWPDEPIEGAEDPLMPRTRRSW